MKEKEVSIVPEVQDKPAKSRKITKARLIAVIAAAMSLVMSFGVFAADGEGEAAGASLTSGVSTLITLVGQVVTLITGNTVLLVFLGAAMLSAAIGIFIRLFRGVRH